MGADLFRVSELVNASVIGRLLEEISWEGRQVARYRHGGAGRENVLTAEVLQALDFLPRDEFLGEVLRAGHGAVEARTRIAAATEALNVVVLPEETRLGVIGPVVQPDAVLESEQAFVLVEAKRILRSSFQLEQLAREYLALMQQAGDRTPLLLLLLGDGPTVRVASRGRLQIDEAVRLTLSEVHARTQSPLDLAELEARLPERLAWITWAEVRDVVARRVTTVTGCHPSMAGTVQRLASTLLHAIDRHSTSPTSSHRAQPD